MRKNYVYTITRLQDICYRRLSSVVKKYDIEALYVDTMCGEPIIYMKDNGKESIHQATEESYRAIEDYDDVIIKLFGHGHVEMPVSACRCYENNTWY